MVRATAAGSEVRHRATLPAAGFRPTLRAGKPMPPLPIRLNRSWFRSPDGRRYFLALAAVIATKIGLLFVLYYALIAPQPRVPRTPEAVRDHLSPAAAREPPDGR